MFTMGSVDEDEGEAPRERKLHPEKTTIAKLLLSFACLYERWRNDLESRRYRDPRDNDPDYARHLRDLEGEIDEREPRLRMFQHNESGGRETSWQKWILGVVSLCMVGMLSWALGKLDTLNQEVAALQATQTMGFQAITQRETADEARIDRLETRVYRGHQ